MHVQAIQLTNTASGPVDKLVDLGDSNQVVVTFMPGEAREVEVGSAQHVLDSDERFVTVGFPKNP